MLLVQRPDGNILNLMQAERFLPFGNDLKVWINGKKYVVLDMPIEYVVSHGTPKLTLCDWITEDEWRDMAHRKK